MISHRNPVRIAASQRNSGLNNTYELLDSGCPWERPSQWGHSHHLNYYEPCNKPWNQLANLRFCCYAIVARQIKKLEEAWRSLKVPLEFCWDSRMDGAPTGYQPGTGASHRQHLQGAIADLCWSFSWASRSTDLKHLGLVRTCEFVEQQRWM